MIAIDVTMIYNNGNPVSSQDVDQIVEDNIAEVKGFFSSCIADGLILNTVTDGLTSFADPPYTSRYYAINTVNATEFQERFMSLTAPFSMQQFWMANGFKISIITQSQIMFEDEPAEDLVPLVDVDDNLLWGNLY